MVPPKRRSIGYTLDYFIKTPFHDVVRFAPIASPSMLISKFHVTAPRSNASKNIGVRVRIEFVKQQNHFLRFMNSMGLFGSAGSRYLSMTPDNSLKSTGFVT